MTKIAIITGSTRPGRLNRQVADWLLLQAQVRGDADYEIVDIADYGLPLLDEPVPAAMAQYHHEHTRVWSAKIAEFDGFIFVTGEYNHSVTPALANAISYLSQEWADKAAGIVSYGATMGVRAAEHLRNILSNVQVAHVQKQGMFSLFSDVENFSTFKPTELQAASVEPMFEQLVSWTKAMKSVRSSEFATV